MVRRCFQTVWPLSLLNACYWKQSWFKPSRLGTNTSPAVPLHVAFKSFGTCAVSSETSKKQSPEIIAQNARRLQKSIIFDAETSQTGTLSLTSIPE